MKPHSKSSYILVVDDNQKNIQVIGNILRSEGYRVGIAIDGPVALRQIEKNKPDLILLDVMMPQMSGLEVCEKLKQNDATKEIPIIFLTAKAETDDVVKGFELGAMDYVTKPFKSLELLSRIRTHLDLKQKTDRLKIVADNQNQLLHVLCHDLTNPIGAVLNFLKLFPQNDYSKCMNLAAENCLKIIDIVRMMLALESHKIEIEIKEEKLIGLIKDSLNILGHKFKSKDVELVLDVDANLTVAVERTSFINSVISNLLTNALKFSFPESKIYLSASEAEGVVSITLKDSGIGMGERLLGNVFDINKTTRRQGTGGETGTGFGMPLVKRFVTAYGGSISITSKEIREYPDDHGTLVTMQLKSR